MSKVKLLLYCTKGLPNITRGIRGTVYPSCIQGLNQRMDHHLNGKIVAECECEKVDYYEMEYYANNLVMNDISIYNKVESEEWGHDCFNRVISNEYSDEEITNCPLLKKSCLTFDELGNYVCPNGGINNFYALHLSNVKVFDEPKELSEYLICNDDKTNLENWKPNQYAPQNMKNVYESCSIVSYFSSKILLKKYVLISIQPQHLCKILNGEKTIEVRKKILNSLKEVL